VIPVHHHPPASLLNDFVSSLNRLGLLQPLEYEDGDCPARQRRVFAYLQKFEASYGPLSRTLSGSAYVAVSAPGSPWSASSSSTRRRRLEEEDIENVPNMATTDIVELFLTTRIPPTA
jgi:hypothetical protein